MRTRRSAPQPGIGPRPPAGIGEAGGERCADALRRQPDDERQRDDADLQHRAGGSDEMPREIGIVLPVENAHGQRRRRGRPEDHRYVDHGRREGEHGEHRQPDLPVERRQHAVEEAGMRP